MELGTINIRVVASFEKMQEGLKKSTEGLSTMDKTLGRVQRSIVAFMALYVFRQFLQGVGEAIKAASDFSLSMAHISRMTEMGQTSLSSLSDTLKNLSTQLPLTANELANMGMIAAQAGVETSAGITKLVTTASKLNTLNKDLKPEETVKALVQLARGFDLPIESAENLASVIQYVGDASVGGAADIVGASLRMVSAGKNLDFTAAQLMALAGATIDVGVSAERAGTVWNRALLQIATNAEKAAGVVGISTEKFRDLIQKNSVDALLLLLGKLGEIENKALRLEKINQIFSGIGLRGAGPLIDKIDELSSVMTKADEVFKDGTYITEQYKKVAGEFAIVVKTSKNEWTLLGQEVGERVLPELTKGLKELSDLAKEMRFFGDFWFGGGWKQFVDAIPVVQEFKTAMQELGQVFFNIQPKIDVEKMVNDAKTAMDAVGGLGLGQEQGYELHQIFDTTLTETNIQTVKDQLKEFNKFRDDLDLEWLTHTQGTFTAAQNLMTTLQTFNRGLWQGMFDFMDMGIKQFSSGFSTALTSIIMGTQKAGEAFKQFGLAMLNSIVQFFTEWAIQSLISMALGKAMLGWVISQAATIGAAWFEPALLASIATLGGAVGIGSAALGAGMATGAGLAGAMGAAGVMGGMTDEATFANFGRHQFGGLLKEPTMMVGMKTGKKGIAGEAGPEAIIPMNQRSQEFAMASSREVNIIINGPVLSDDPILWDKITREHILPAMDRDNRRQVA